MNNIEINGYLAHEPVHPDLWDAFGGFSDLVAEVAVSVLQGILVCVPPEPQEVCVFGEQNGVLVTTCGECLFCVTGVEFPPECPYGEDDDAFFAAYGLEELTPEDIAGSGGFCGAGYGIAKGPCNWVASNFAASSGTPGVVVSASGKKWAKIIDAEVDKGGWYDALYSSRNSQFVIAGSQHAIPTVRSVARSVDDGLTWLFDGDLVDTFETERITETAQRYIIVQQNVPGKVAFSPDAISWTVSDILATGGDVLGGQDTAYSPTLGRLVIVGVGFFPTNVINYSDDEGDTWNTVARPSGTLISFSHVMWSSRLGLFIAVGIRFDGGLDNIISTSADGITWNVIVTPSNVDSLAWTVDATAMGKIVFLGYDVDEDKTALFSTTDFISFDSLTVDDVDVSYLIRIEYSPDQGANGRIIMGGKKEPNDMYFAWTDDLLTIIEATP
jgi:hypothetical protein